MVKRAGGALLHQLIIDTNSGRTIAAQLVTGLRGFILGGGLRPGERLPASRTLAAELGVARATVVEAFEQLAAEGLIETRVGAGSFVSQRLDEEHYTQDIVVPSTANPPRIAQPARLARLMDAATGRFNRRLRHEPRAFTTAMPAYDAFPVAQWSRLVAKHWRGDRSRVFGYNDPHGEKSLRQAIAQHLRSNRGVPCDWPQVFIFAGAQQAFQAVASILVDPGDKVWFENPGAIGARNCFFVHGAQVVPVPVDDDGLRVDIGIERAADFRLAFVTPAHQQPLGVTMSYDRRLALLQAANAAAAWIVEDDWDGDFCFAGRPLPALKSIDLADRVIYVGTFSKSLFPALRIGFAVAPRSLVQTFEVALGAFSSAVPTSLQSVVADFMMDGHFASHIRRMRKLYAERHAALIEAATEKLTPWLEMMPTATGLQTVGFLKRGLNGADVAAAAESHDLTVAPISRFCVEPHSREGLVFGFSGISPARIKAGVAVLASVFADFA